MSKVYLTVFLIATSNSLFGQSLSEFVVNTTGNSYKNSDFSLEYSIGETAIHSFQSVDFTLEEGYLSSNKNTVTGISEVGELSNFHIYPNPVNSFLYISSLNEIITHYTLYDITGKSIIKGTWKGSINIQEFKEGIYILSTQSSNGKVKIFKIFKH